MGSGGYIDPSGEGEFLPALFDNPPSREPSPPVLPGMDLSALDMPSAESPQGQRSQDLLAAALRGAARDQMSRGESPLRHARQGPRPTATVTQVDLRAPTMKMPAVTVKGDTRAQQIAQRPGLQQAMAMKPGIQARALAQALGFNVEDVADEAAVTRALAKLTRGMSVAKLLGSANRAKTQALFQRLLQEEAAKMQPTQMAAATKLPVQPT